MDDFSWDFGCTIWSIIIGTIVSLVLLFVFCYHKVDTGNVGMIIDYANSSNNHLSIETVQPGQYRFIWPFSGQVLVTYPIAQQSLVLSSNAQEGELQGDSTIACQTNGGGIVNLGEAITWQVDALHPYILYQKNPNLDLTSSLNNDVNTRVVLGAVQGATLDICSKYTWQDLLGDGTQSKVQQFRNELLQELQASLAPNGIVVNQVFIKERNPDAAILAVLNAHNDAQKSDYLKLQAQNESDAEIAKAQGEAQAIKIVNDQLNAASPTYVNYLIAKQWDGKLPSTVASNGTSTVLAPFGK